MYKNKNFLLFGKKYSLAECNGGHIYFLDLILEAFFFRPSSINLCITTVFLFDSGDTGATPFLVIFLVEKLCMLCELSIFNLMLLFPPDGMRLP